MRFYVHKLGCPKNDVDGDYIAARLIDAGHQPAASAEEAESVIVNTCGFIQTAKEESINEILRLAALKKIGQLQTLYATGCLTQRNGDEMLAEMPELDGAFGHGALDSLAQAVTGSTKLERTVRIESRKLGYLSWKHRYISDGYPYAYLKISDGCDRGCTYCAIPGMRGKFRSRPMASIVNEARFLAANGKKELILVSQEATLWGYDLPGTPALVDLLKELNAVDGVVWIRPMYLYPAKLDNEVIDYFGSGTKVLPYFDLPLQHINSRILDRMHRQIDRPGIERLMGEIRSRVPHATIRTTFIVGFPGETESDFGELCDFIEESQFDRLGVFAYSAEEGTPAADYGDQASDEVKAERIEIVMSIQREIALAKNAALVGKTLPVIIDEIDATGPALGRSGGDCPEVDQSVYVHGRGLRVGDMMTVKVTEVEGYDLVGSPV
ncbi:MAG: 30S ribosomal protein S12 methylthiotransferase RimO [candidate division Zixibacteria bacterium]|nr:30S ribosomal protein S12 methylthiotransferase RimO [candidate division Zixibacteria bacterium]